MFLESETSAAGPSSQPSLNLPTRNVQKWILPNGLTIIVEEDHSAPVASVQAWCLTGSIHENALIGSGLSHILEHMLFKGTKTRPPNTIASEVQDEGGYINAYTSFDRTVYWIDVPKTGVGKAVDILSDAMMNATLPEAEYIKEQDVIRREFAMGYDDPDRMTSLLLFSTAYREHPYRYPVIGHLSLYNKLTRDDVLRYYKARYVPNNLVFVIVGDVDGEKIHAQMEDYFKDYPRAVLPPIYIPEEPPQLGRREVHQEFPTELSRLQLAWHIPGIDHPDIPALDVLSAVMGDGRSARFYRQLREEKGLVYSISCSAYTPYYPGLLIVSAAMDPAKREAATLEIETMLGEVASKGITVSELDRAKKMLLAGQISGLTTTRGRAGDLGSSWLLARNLDFSRDYLASLQKVTIQEIQGVAKKYLRPENETVVSLNPAGTLAKAPVVNTAPVAKPIQKFTLSNGLRLLVREDSRLPLISVHAVFKGGLLVETPKNAGISSLFARILLRGTKNRTGEQIASEIESVGGSISSNSGNNSFAISVDGTKADLPLMLDLLSDVIQHPVFPEAAIAREKESQIASQKAEQEQMTAVARNLLRATAFPNHPYGLNALGTPETVAALTREDLQAYQRELTVASNGVLAVFGDVQASTVRDLCEKYFATMPVGKPALEKIDQPAPLPQTVTKEAIQPKVQAVLMIGYPSIDLFSPDKSALDLIDEASSDLGSRFFTAIRENLGLCYYVGSTQLTGLAPGLFTFYVGTDPKKIDKVQAALTTEIDKLAAYGLTEKELNRAKRKLLGQQAIQNQSNDSLAYSCALNEIYGLGYDYYLGTEKRINSVTLDEVKRVAQKYFLNQPRVITVVHPATLEK